jgi:hypothetical protein
MAEVHEISWNVASHSSRERSNDWYWGLGGLALVGAVLSIIFGNILLAIIITLGSISIGFLAGRVPREHSVVLSERGVSIDGTRYPYASVQSFWVEEHEGHPKLFISLRGIISPHHSLYIPEEISPSDVRTFLKRFATEEEQGPQLGEHLAEIFGLN